MVELAQEGMLITGFPGFLAGKLLEKLAVTTEGPLFLLVLPPMVKAGQRQVRHLVERFPGLAERMEIISGDITRKRLGMGEKVYERLLEEVGLVWHLAAIYDLAVEAQVAFRVNVGGTYEVLDFCEAAKVKRLNHISTCYVSGTRTGRILETELDCGQRHHNHYETTKFWSEVEVQRRMKEIPTAVFRPGITVGDSRTGETPKYDGPYYIFQLLNRLPRWMPFPNIGRGDAVVNLVPVDFVVQALATLGLEEETTGRVFHLADPHPMTAKQIVDATLRHFGHPPAQGKVPASWVERALENGLVREWTGIPAEALAYFNHDALYDTSQTEQALEKTSIRCPHLSTYLSTLLDTFLRYPDSPPPGR